MDKSQQDRELGQFIPLAYHFNMLNDEARMIAFHDAIARVVTPGCRVLELGGGTGVLSFLAASRGASVCCVELNPELVREARRILALNPAAARVSVLEADAFDYLPSEPVDVVICEMLHVGMLREKQIQVIDSFKRRYRTKFGNTLPHFIPEAFFHAVQPVQQSFDFHGYYAPITCFQDPVVAQRRTVELGRPVVYQSGAYGGALSLDCSWQGELAIDQPGQLNAVRFITKNVLTVIEAEQRTVDWFNQYLIVPIMPPLPVESGSRAVISFSYQTGDPIAVLKPEVRLRQ